MHARTLDWDRPGPKSLLCNKYHSTRPWSHYSHSVSIIFPTASAHFVSLLHFGNPNNISNSVIILTFVNVIFDVTVAKRLQLSKGSDDG